MRKKSKANPAKSLNGRKDMKMHKTHTDARTNTYAHTCTHACTQSICCFKMKGVHLRMAIYQDFRLKFHLALLMPSLTWPVLLKRTKNV